MNKHHLAQINIAQAKDGMESSTMQGFVNRLDEINALADQSPGFVWRLQTDDGDATSIQVYDNPLIIVNMSVWDNIASLKHFVYKTVHVELIKDRDAWFDKMPEMHQALWWVPAGHVPSVQEGQEKLKLLQEHGATKKAFTFARFFDFDG